MVGFLLLVSLIVAVVLQVRHRRGWNAWYWYTQLAVVAIGAVSLSLEDSKSLWIFLSLAVASAAAAASKRRAVADEGGAGCQACADRCGGEMTLPTFLGIGVPRGGTTWLHTWLDSHPQVCMSTRRKEVRFFDRHYERGLGWYESFFCPPEERDRYSAVGEISPQYYLDPDCAKRIAAALPDVRLVVMMRHPVTRAYSNYGFCVQRANYRGSFERFLIDQPNALDKGFYGRHLRRYLRHFERDQILALVLEQSLADIGATQATRRSLSRRRRGRLCTRSFA